MPRSTAVLEFRVLYTRRMTVDVVNNTQNVQSSGQYAKHHSRRPCILKFLMCPLGPWLTARGVW